MAEGKRSHLQSLIKQVIMLNYVGLCKENRSGLVMLSSSRLKVIEKATTYRLSKWKESFDIIPFLVHFVRDSSQEICNRPLHFAVKPVL